MRLFIFLLFLLPCATFARLGETEEQDELRYGLARRTGVLSDAGIRRKQYEKDGWKIVVDYRAGRSVRVEYRRGSMEGGVMLKPYERESILRVESAGQKWTPCVAPGEKIESAFGRLMLAGMSYRRLDGAVAVFDMTGVVVSSAEMIEEVLRKKREGEVRRRQQVRGL